MLCERIERYTARIDFNQDILPFLFLTRILFAFISVMVNSEGFMEYIVQLIYSMANKTADHLRANPLLIAHCIGAMKIITAISISQEIHVMPL